MLKVNHGIENIINTAQSIKNSVKEAGYKQIRELEIQRQKYLFKVKHESLMELTDTVILRITEFIAIHQDREIFESLKSKILRISDKIEKDMDYFEASLIGLKGDASRNEREVINNCIIKLHFWQKDLQDKTDYILSCYEQPRNPSKKNNIVEEGRIVVKKNLEHKIVEIINFYRSLEQIEIDDVNKHFDHQQKIVEVTIAETFRLINSDLANQIAISELTAATDCINLDAETRLNTEDIGNKSEEIMPLAGNPNILLNFHEL